MLKVIDEGAKERHIPTLGLATEESAKAFFEKVKSLGYEFVVSRFRIWRA